MYYIRPNGCLQQTPYDSGNPGVRVLERQIALALLNAKTGDIIHSKKQSVYFAVFDGEIKKCKDANAAEQWIRKKEDRKNANIASDGSAPDLKQESGMSGYAFCDGSFMKGKIGSGYILVEEDPSQHDKTVIEKSFRVPYSDLKNISGEIAAALNAAKTAYQHGCKKLTIYHDFDGISYFSDYSGNKKELREYAKDMKEYRKNMKISFIKVQAHSGSDLNDKADRLAKDACK